MKSVSQSIVALPAELEDTADASAELETKAGVIAGALLPVPAARSDEEEVCGDTGLLGTAPVDGGTERVVCKTELLPGTTAAEEDREELLPIGGPD